jgi:stringent starvation protein B
VTELTSTRPYLLRALYEWMADNGLTAHVIVDAGAAGVQVPRQAVRDGQVILNISAQATHRLALGNDALRFAARFGGREEWVEVPVAAVRAIFARENGRGMSFEDDNGPPPQAPPPAEPDGGPPGAPRGRPQLKVVK